MSLLCKNMSTSYPIFQCYLKQTTSPHNNNNNNSYNCYYYRRRRRQVSSSLKYNKNQTFPPLQEVPGCHSSFQIRDIRYRPPGTELNLLNDVNFTLPEKSFGLIFGRSGSGKTTLLQLIAGLTKPTSGSICVQRYGDDGNPNEPPVVLSPERVGIVFQFPERYFVADNVFEEITFGLPRQKSDFKTKERIAKRLERAITSVGLNGISFDKNPNSLSGGYKRRLALAIQLVQTPELLVLDEPLAGLES
uniref:ABC transporter I family member 11, chloroplastic isoform X2 n=1 Tax=Erigeron canadensis TaxID=72917 RepID=UPI001CB8BB55|nr:ABC transporter I family member 11, chloroplastic isoform X2 [Erigeron canadensis]